MTTDSDVDRYLNELCWAMGGSFAEQQAVRDELRAHVRDSMRDATLRGITPEDAVLVTLRDLGDPSELGRALRASRGTRPLRKPILQPSGAVAIGRRRVRNLPPLPVSLALAAAVLTPPAIILMYAWP